MEKRASPAQRQRLTKKLVEQFMKDHPGDVRSRLWDAELPGLHLQITPNGTASYCLRYLKPNGVKGDFAIGRANLIGPEQAREAAKARLARLVLDGVDPVKDRASRRKAVEPRRGPTFGELARDFIKAKKKVRAKDKKYQDEWVLHKYVFPHLEHIEAGNITRKLVSEVPLLIQRDIARRNAGKSERSGKELANRAFGTINRVFEWAVEDERLVRNPSSKRRPFRVKPAKRIGVLNARRFNLIWREIDTMLDQYSNERCPEAVQSRRVLLAMQFYMATLQRPIDAGRMRKSHLNVRLGEWRIPEGFTKTCEPYFVPLGQVAKNVLAKSWPHSNDTYVFPSNRLQPQVKSQCVTTSMISRKLNEVLERVAQREDWPEGPKVQLYDFRKFGRTQLVHKLGYSKDVAERVINHAEKKTIENVYDVNDYEPEVRKAQSSWNLEIEEMVYGSAPESQTGRSQYLALPHLKMVEPTSSSTS